MSRLIDADALKDKVKDFPYGYRGMILQVIEQAESVDAVEVVRCSECNRREEPRDTGLKAFVWCNFYNTHKLKDGYCNCGERKDGEVIA